MPTPSCSTAVHGRSTYLARKANHMNSDATNPINPATSNSAGGPDERGSADAAVPDVVAGEAAALLTSWAGPLLPRAKVMDDLLDLRGVLGEYPAARARLDAALGSLPGQNLVAREWAVSAVTDVLSSFAELTPAGSGA
jgi:hypothetical protein